MKYALILMVSWVCCAPALSGASRIEEVSFESHGVSLAGSIVLPEGDIQAAVVFVHGSGKQARNLALAESFARDGIAALVYDKRGAGKSGGEYEQNQNVNGKNILLLADDALAAVSALSKPSPPEGHFRRARGHQPGGLDSAVGRGEQPPGEVPGDVERADLQGE